MIFTHHTHERIDDNRNMLTRQRFSFEIFSHDNTGEIKLFPRTNYSELFSNF